MKRLEKRADLEEFGTSLQNKERHGSGGRESIFSPFLSFQELRGITQSQVDF